MNLTSLSIVVKKKILSVQRPSASVAIYGGYITLKLSSVHQLHNLQCYIQLRQLVL